MNLLDRLLREVAPYRALRRAQARAALEVLDGSRRYEAASRSRRTTGWNARDSDPNSEVGSSLELLRARHRQLVRDNPWANRAQRVIVNHAVGTGILARPLTPRKRVNRRLADLWRAWAETPESCDAGGRLNLYGIQRLAMRATSEGGEVLLRRVWETDRGAVLPFTVQLLEADHLATELTRELPAGGGIIQGVEYDRDSRRVAYHLHRSHPGGTHVARSRGTTRVDARDMLHSFRVDRIGQVRGVPWGAPLMLRLRDWDLYEDAQLLRQRIAACFVAFEHDISGDQELSSSALPPGFTQGGDPDGADTQQLQPGTWEKLTGGRTVDFAVPPGVDGYEANAKINARAVAMGYGLTYEQLTGDLSTTNYSSARVGHVEQRLEVEDWRWQLAIPQVSARLWGWFVDAAVLAGEVEPAADLRSVAWTPPRQELLDPSVEIPAAREGVRAGFQSLSEVIRSWGYEPQEVLAELAGDLRQLDELGVASTSDARRVQQGGAPELLDELDEGEQAEASGRAQSALASGRPLN